MSKIEFYYQIIEQQNINNQLMNKSFFNVPIKIQ